MNQIYIINQYSTFFLDINQPATQLTSVLQLRKDRGRYRSRRRSDSRKRSEQRIHRSRSPRNEKDKSERKSLGKKHLRSGLNFGPIFFD